MSTFVYDDIEVAQADMIAHYGSLTQDEYRVDPNSVTLLYLPDFKGPTIPF